MRLKRVISRKKGRAGWQARFVDPLTGTRKKKTFWYRNKARAEAALHIHMDSRQAMSDGVPDTLAWRTPYDELVRRFIAGADISSESRRKYLKRVLEENPLHIQVAAELTQLAVLTEKCRGLTSAHSAYFVAHRVQGSLKQLAAWAATNSVLPSNPLVSWKRLEWGGHKKKRRAFTPDDLRAVLTAACELDEVFSRKYPSAIVFKTLLFSGNRPTAIFSANVGSLDSERIHLGAGNGKKRNGVSTLPEQFMIELRQYISTRHQKCAETPLLVSHKGVRIDGCNISKDFRRAMILAFVKKHWPPERSNVEPIEVADVLTNGRLRGVDGPPPKDEKKILARKQYKSAVEGLALRLKPLVDADMQNRDMYCLRKTHISWARQVVNHDSVRLQVGHAAQDTEERHYVDLVDARLSSQAVWEILAGTKILSGQRQTVIANQTESADENGPIVAPVAVVPQELQQSLKKSSSQIVVGRAIKIKAGDGVRSRDLRLGKPPLYR